MPVDAGGRGEEGGGRREGGGGGGGGSAMSAGLIGPCNNRLIIPRDGEEGKRIVMVESNLPVLWAGGRVGWGCNDVTI